MDRKRRSRHWKTCHDVQTHDAGLGIYIADLATQKLSDGTQVKFTFYWPDAGHWEGRDFMVRIDAWRRDDTVPSDRSEADEK